MARITQESPDQDDVQALLREAEPYVGHPAGMEALSSSDNIVLVARNGKQAVACAAILMGGDREAEIQSFYVAPDVRKQGIGQAMMGKIIDTSRRYGMRWLRIETGAANAGALALLHKNKFKDCPPFSGYAPEPGSVFLEMAP
jgi:putative acetyltransferase